MAGIGARLREERLRRGFTEREVGEAIGVSRQTIIGWEKDRHVPNPPNLRALCLFLGLDPAELQDGRRRRGLRYADLSEGTFGVGKEFERMIEDDPERKRRRRRDE